MRTTWMTWLVLALALCLACNEDDDDAADDDTGDDDTADDDAGDDDTGDDDAGDDDTGDDDTGDDDTDPCPTGFDVQPGTVYYVDPALGDDQKGDGSAGNPWASIQYVVNHLVDCTDEAGAPLHKNAPVQGGDTIVLVGAAGHDFQLDISGCYNSDYVEITAEVLHEPVLGGVHFRGSSYWRLDGLTFQRDDGGTMLRAEDHEYQGECHDLEIVNNHFTSGNLVTLQDYVDQASTGIYLLHGPEYVTVQCNSFLRVGQAMSVFGDHIDVLDNTVEFFSRDGIATGGHHNRFLRNRLYDAIYIDDGHHDDFFQSHMGNDPDTSSDVEIAYNVFWQRYSKDQPVESWSATQCLSAFNDGPKTDIRIYNNVCKTDHWHGISWYDTNDSIIINNTVIGGTELPGLPPGSEKWPDHTWIYTDGTNNIVRNNLTTYMNTAGDHNLEVTAATLDDFFVDFAAGDLRLVPKAPAVDAGSTDQAPADDVRGELRDATPDVGAYEYVPAVDD